MALELEFRVSRETTPDASATVVLNSFTAGDSGLPHVTSVCATMGELEGQLELLENQIVKIRAAARKQFLEAGISN
jgi:hypothetical protein